MQRITLDVARDRLTPADRAAVEERARTSAARGAWKAWLVVLSLERGDFDEAARLLAEEIDDLDAIPMDANWLYAMTTPSRGWVRVPRRRRRRRTALSAGPAAREANRGRRARRLVSRLGCVLARSPRRGAGHDSAAARHLTDAVATNDRMGAAPFAAVARHELATVLAREGDHARAETLHAEAIAAGRELGMALPHDILRRF